MEKTADNNKEIKHMVGGLLYEKGVYMGDFKLDPKSDTHTLLRVCKGAGGNTIKVQHYNGGAIEKIYYDMDTNKLLSGSNPTNEDYEVIKRATREAVRESESSI